MSAGGTSFNNGSDLGLSQRIAPKPADLDRIAGKEPRKTQSPPTKPQQVLEPKEKAEKDAFVRHEEKRSLDLSENRKSAGQQRNERNESAVSRDPSKPESQGKTNTASQVFSTKRKEEERNEARKLVLEINSEEEESSTLKTSTTEAQKKSITSTAKPYSEIKGQIAKVNAGPLKDPASKKIVDDLLAGGPLIKEICEKAKIPHSVLNNPSRDDVNCILEIVTNGVNNPDKIPTWKELIKLTEENQEGSQRVENLASAKPGKEAEISFLLARGLNANSNEIAEKNVAASITDRKAALLNRLRQNQRIAKVAPPKPDAPIKVSARQMAVDFITNEFTLTAPWDADYALAA